VNSSAVQRQIVRYPGGYRAVYAWGGPTIELALEAAAGDEPAILDLADLGGSAGDRLCHASIDVSGPTGGWAALLAAPIFDAPQGLLWDSAGLLLVAYGFRAYAFEARGGQLRWSFDSATPLVAILGSPRLEHVLVQGELETTALDAAGEVAWRASHEDVITAAELMAGRLVASTWSGATVTIDPRTGARLA